MVPFEWWLLLVLATVLALGFVGVPLWAWTAAGAALLWLVGAPIWIWIPFGLVAVFFNVRPLRARLLTAPVARRMKAAGLLPSISETERVALEAGTVWMDAELFGGKPSLRRVLEQPYPSLTDEDRAFLEGPVEEVCRMVDDWQAHVDGDFPPEVWSYLKREGFFGLIVPKRYGGRELSASALSAVIHRLASRSFPLSVTVMIPNSLGPAELLHLYGTEAQKNELLPMLADGRHMPCFALTEPKAGSDAGALGSTGTVFRGEDGRPMLRLTWTKRWCSLSAVSTIIGMAFKLRDPENILGQGADPGITCALVPTDTPGVEVSSRHDPLGVPFYNSPLEGRDVVVPADAIIGGPAMAGKGWMMLMEALSAGRGIALPGACVAVAKRTLRSAGSYAAVRHQFGLPIGRFEGIEEPLARIVGEAYLMEAARAYTCGAVDAGEKPSVVSAIVKYQLTESWRRVVNDGMDITAGAGISRGPRNLLAHLYQAAPIPITVEGANILTRTMIVFGQGALRCHPFAHAELEALMKDDVAAFDRVLFRHAGHTFRNAVRAKLLAFSGGWLALAPVGGPAARYWRRLSRASATFALVADVAMITLGGALKRREKLTGRLADALSGLYLAAAVLRRFEAEGRPAEDRAILRWTCDLLFHRVHEALLGAIRNFPARGPARLLRSVGAGFLRTFPLGAPPSDDDGAKLARIALSLSAQRERLTEGLCATVEGEALHRLERAHRLGARADEIAGKLRSFVKEGKLAKARPEALLQPAMEQGLIGADEIEEYRAAVAAREDAIAVDDFPLADYRRAVPLPTDAAPRG
ncbi:MAG: acyl-CoA dehydrogenase [Planctomycetota bacterium]